jgi:hypothetical protein
MCRRPTSSGTREVQKIGIFRACGSVLITGARYYASSKLMGTLTTERDGNIFVGTALDRYTLYLNLY